MRDALYENVPFRLSELKHHYGPRVHLVGNPFLLSQLATLCAKETVKVGRAHSGAMRYERREHVTRSGHRHGG